MNVSSKFLASPKAKYRLAVFEGEHTDDFVNFLKAIHIIVFFCKYIHEIRKFVVIIFTENAVFCGNSGGYKIGRAIILRAKISDYSSFLLQWLSSNFTWTKDNLLCARAEPRVCVKKWLAKRI